MTKIALGLIGATALLRTLAALLRWAWPRLCGRMAAACGRMMDAMPESFPPKRMMADISESRDYLARILRLLEQDRASADRRTPAGAEQIASVSKRP